MDLAESSQHWDAAYDEGDVTRSWYQAEAAQSLSLILRAHSLPVSVVDVGGGASTLVDGLLAAGWSDVTVTDISPVGLATAQNRLGPAAEDVTWIPSDVRTWPPPRTWEVWHDRAVLHFMTSPDDLAAYRRALLAGTTAGSLVIVGCFGPDGPTMCSGLPVHRYDRESLAAFLGEEFVIEDSETVDHVTPHGATQQFLWLVARRTPGA